MHLVIRLNFMLERINFWGFFLPLPKERVLIAFGFVCTQSVFVGRFCYSVCLCLSPAGHNFKPIFTKLHQMVEFVIRKKSIVFEDKRSTDVKGQQLRWFF